MIGLGLIAAAMLVFWICMPRDGMVRPFLQSYSLQMSVGMFITVALTAGVLLILNGTFG